MINLSDKDIQCDNTNLYEDFRLWISFSNKKEMFECKKQIMENQEKAGKWDSVSNLGLIHDQAKEKIIQLQQEKEQLKEKIGVLMSQIHITNKQLTNVVLTHQALGQDPDSQDSSGVNE